jgi:hypothetical protein
MEPSLQLKRQSAEWRKANTEGVRPMGRGGGALGGFRRSGELPNCVCKIGGTVEISGKRD